jgi:hypothetical protein
MPYVRYISYSFSPTFFDERSFLDIRQMSKEQFAFFLEDKTNELRIAFWADHSDTLKISLGAIAVAGALAFVPFLSILAALAFVGGFFGLMSILLSAFSHSMFKARYRDYVRKVRKISKSSTSYENFLANI